MVAQPEARVSVSGDARAVWLERSTDRRRFELGAVPPGRYQVYAMFESDLHIATGEISLQDGERRVLRCNARAAICR